MNCEHQTLGRLKCKLRSGGKEPFWSGAQGELLAFDAYHRRNKVLYDDGAEEWVSLQREMFCWLTPRARAAGGVPSLAPLLGASAWRRLILVAAVLPQLPGQLDPTCARKGGQVGPLLGGAEVHLLVIGHMASLLACVSAGGVWAASAGATEKLAAAMRVLGAVNARPQCPAPPPAAAPAIAEPPAAAPQTALEAAQALLAQPLPGSSAAPPASAAAAACGSEQPAAAAADPNVPQGPAAVGWRVSLPFEGEAARAVVQSCASIKRRNLLTKAPVEVHALNVVCMGGLVLKGCATDPAKGFAEPPRACAGDGTAHTGEVLAYKEASGQHLLFYEDGEHEWVHLHRQPAASWQPPLPGAAPALGLLEGAVPLFAACSHLLMLPIHLWHRMHCLPLLTWLLLVSTQCGKSCLTDPWQVLDAGCICARKDEQNAHCGAC